MILRLEKVLSYEKLIKAWSLKTKVTLCVRVSVCVNMCAYVCDLWRREKARERKNMNGFMNIFHAKRKKEIIKRCQDHEWCKFYCMLICFYDIIRECNV